MDYSILKIPGFSWLSGIFHWLLPQKTGLPVLPEVPVFFLFIAACIFINRIISCPKVRQLILPFRVYPYTLITDVWWGNTLTSLLPGHS